MLVGILRRALCKPHTFLAQHFSRRVRGVKKGQDPEEEPKVVGTSQMMKIQRYRKREEAIMGTSKRALREENEDIEREIVRLIDQDKTNEEIIEELRQKDKGTNNKPMKSFDMFSQKADAYQETFGFTKKMSIPQSIEYKQMSLLEHIKREAQQDKSNRTKKQKKTEEAQYDEVSVSIPEPFRESVENFKNKELKYLSNLVENRTPQGKHIHRRVPKGYVKPASQQLVESDPTVMKSEASTGVVAVESKEQKITRMLERFSETTLSKQEQTFLEKGEENLKISEKNTNLYLREFDNKFGMFQAQIKTSHNVQKVRVASLMKQLKDDGIVMSGDEIKQIEKDTLFESKHNLEELELFRKRLEKRERQKKKKIIDRDINQEELSSQNESKQIFQPLDFKMSKHKLNFGVPNHDKLNEINKNYARSMFSAESRKVDHLEGHTNYNIEQWLWYQFIDGVSNRVSPVLDKIAILSIRLNDANTTVTIRWRLGTKLPAMERKIPKPDDEEKDVEETQQTLNKLSSYLSGRMCQDLGLRFGPLIKFKYVKPDPDAEKAKEEVKSQMLVIVKAKLAEELKKGAVPGKMKPAELNKLLNNLETAYEQKIEEISFSVGKMTKNKDKKAKQRDNRREDGSKKKSKKKKGNPADQFWNGL